VQHAEEADSKSLRFCFHDLFLIFENSKPPTTARGTLRSAWNFKNSEKSLRNQNSHQFPVSLEGVLYK
jgi:hypothetical protein